MLIVKVKKNFSRQISSKICQAPNVHWQLVSIYSTILLCFPQLGCVDKCSFCLDYVQVLHLLEAQGLKVNRIVTPDSESQLWLGLGVRRTTVRKTLILFHDLGHLGLTVLNQGIYLSLTYTKEDTHHHETFEKILWSLWTLFFPPKLIRIINPVTTSC